MADSAPGGLVVGAGHGQPEDVGHRDLAGIAVGLDGLSSIKGVLVEEDVERLGVLAMEPGERPLDVVEMGHVPTSWR